MNLVPIWASRSPGDFVPHLDLIAVDSFLASPGTGDSDPNWASPRSGDSGPHLGIIGTWLLCSTPEPQVDLLTMVPKPASHRPVALIPTEASRVPGNSGPHLGLIWT